MAHRSWTPIGTGLVAPMSDEYTSSDRRVMTHASGTAADASSPTTETDARSFSVEHMEYVDLLMIPRSAADTAYTGPAGTMTVRLYWIDENSGEWFGETTTITLPHASAHASNQNHEVQRPTYGKRRGCVVVETKTVATDILYVHANGTIP
jgi:hypothetical protein